MTSIDNTVEFTDEQVSEWILHKIWNNTTYLDSISKVNDIRWYSNEYIGMLISVIVTSYKRTNKAYTRGLLLEFKVSCRKERGINLDFNTLVENCGFCIQLVVNMMRIPSKMRQLNIVKKGGEFIYLKTF